MSKRLNKTNKLDNEFEDENGVRYFVCCGCLQVTRYSRLDIKITLNRLEHENPLVKCGCCPNDNNVNREWLLELEKKKIDVETVKREIGISKLKKSIGNYLKRMNAETKEDKTFPSGGITSNGYEWVIPKNNNVCQSVLNSLNELSSASYFPSIREIDPNTFSYKMEYKYGLYSIPEFYYQLDKINKNYNKMKEQIFTIAIIKTVTDKERKDGKKPEILVEPTHRLAECPEQLKQSFLIENADKLKDLDGKFDVAIKEF